MKREIGTPVIEQVVNMSVPQRRGHARNGEVEHHHDSKVDRIDPDLGDDRNKDRRQQDERGGALNEHPCDDQEQVDQQQKQDGVFRHDQHRFCHQGRNAFPGHVETEGAGRADH